MVIGYHIILTGYGHWLPNDPRGSMSEQVYSPDLAPLAEIHFGRKAVQPPIQELREFYIEAQKRLAHPILWWDEAHRQGLADVFDEVVRKDRLTCYACSILSNHVHLLVRKHRLKAELISRRIRERGRLALTQARLTADGHPVFSSRSCNVFKSDVTAMRNCVAYIQSNFRKHNLTPQTYRFVTPYNNWPFHNKKRSK